MNTAANPRAVILTAVLVLVAVLFLAFRFWALRAELNAAIQDREKMQQRAVAAETLVAVQGAQLADAAARAEALEKQVATVIQDAAADRRVRDREIARRALAPPSPDCETAAEALHATIVEGVVGW